MARELTRKELLKAGAATAAAASLAPLFPEHVARALAAPAPSCAQLKDIEHVVILVQENRGFDHYFGTYPGVRGFSDSQALRLNDGSGLSVFAQPGYDVAGHTPAGHLLPFRLNTQNGGNGECTNDITHNWGPQHISFNNGAMDKFVIEHLKADPSPANGALTMGYYERADLAYYHALADAFTICDGYHCSVLGPTDPNRLYTVSAWLDPDGKNGGPMLKTDAKVRGVKGNSYDFTWTTMPEQLRAAGISWKVYSDQTANVGGDNILLDFTKFRSDPVLAANAFAPTFSGTSQPDTFRADIAAGTLPQVSWVLAPLLQNEHPPLPIAEGEYATSQVLSALTANPAVWAKTALFVTWDENGGFFDHVPPPVAPPGTPGEYVSNPLPADAEGIAGPIGLGFRVPLLVISPFSRGGFVCSDRFDHTSLLRFLETRFGAEVPNLTDWRRSVTGDLTSAFNFAQPDSSVPNITQPSPADPALASSNCVKGGGDYPVPLEQQLPSQEPGSPKRPSGLLRGATAGSATANPLGLPAEGGCMDTRHFSFHVHRPHGRRVVRVDAFVDGRHLKTVRARHGQSVGRIVLSPMPQGQFTLRIVAHTSNHHRIASIRQYHGCTKGPPHTLHGHRHRHHHPARKH